MSLIPKNIPLRLTKERWNYIVLRHPEIDGQDEEVYFNRARGSESPK